MNAMTKDAFVAHVKQRWWFVALQAIVVTAVVTAVLAVRGDTSHTRTTEFVLHPATTSSPGDVNNGIDVSGQDGPLVQTVLKVLGSGSMLERAGKDAGVADLTPYSISASVSPGSNYFDVVIEGPDAPTVARLGTALETVAPAYVENAYRGFAFDALDHGDATNTSFPPGSDVVLLALVLGAAAAVAELFVVFALRSAPPAATPIVVTGASRRVAEERRAAEREDDEDDEIAGPDGNGSTPGVPVKTSTAHSSRRRRTPAAS